MNPDAGKIDLAVQRYRVMKGDKIVGQFSNRQLADRSARERPGAVVLDVSVQPPKVVYRDGKWLEKST